MFGFSVRAVAVSGFSRTVGDRWCPASGLTNSEQIPTGLPGVVTGQSFLADVESRRFAYARFRVERWNRLHVRNEPVP